MNERLERSHSLIHGLFEVTAKKRTVNVALESLSQWIGAHRGDERCVDREAGRSDKARQGFKGGAGLSALDACHNRLPLFRLAAQARVA